MYFTIFDMVEVEVITGKEIYIKTEETKRTLKMLVIFLTASNSITEKGKIQNLEQRRFFVMLKHAHHFLGFLINRSKYKIITAH